jgi:hypothetical protein
MNMGGPHLKPVKWLILLPLLILVNSAGAESNVQFRGYSLTDWYSFQSRDSTHHQQFFETVSFRLEHNGVNSLGLVTHVRWEGDNADNFDSSSVLRVHNLYLRFNHADKLDLRVGRQFLAEGVGIGTFDAVRLNFSCKPGRGLTLWNGIAARDDRKAEIQQWRDDKAFGGALRTRIHDKASLVGSYFYEERAGLKFRHRAGLAGTFGLTSSLTGTAQAYFNLSGPSVVHRIRALIRYAGQSNFRFSFEGALGTPQLYPDSPFSNVDPGTFLLGRVSGAYRLTEEYWLGLQVQSLLVSKTPNTNLGLTLEGSWGSFGYRQRFGTYGDESGIFGSGQYNLTDFAEIYGAADFSRYKFEDWNQTDDQAEGQAGLRLRVAKPLLLDASIQAMRNTQFDRDIRGLLRVKWSFSN